MKDWIIGIMDSLGYGGVALLMFLENIFPPIPSELIMPLSGFAAAQGKMSLVGVIIAGTVGSVLGQIPLYYLGHFVGKKRLMRLADKYGKWLTVGGEEIEAASKWFARRGSIAVLICRLVPGVRSLISIPAGICGMNLLKFCLYSAVGMGAWSAALAWAGHLLGENYERVEKFVGPATYVVFGIIAIALTVWVIRRKKQKRAGGATASSTTHADQPATDDCAAT